ncbi:MAG: ABC transporter permease, partial [Anaeromyxobacteraceae bacterium]|nr:ABC transporter permease [Anaeromyxobacteraceae bacterium]
HAEPRHGSAGASGSAVPANWQQARELTTARRADLVELWLRVGTLQGAPAAIVSADPAGLARMTPYWAVNGTRAAEQDECVMGRRLAQLLGASVGSAVEVRFDGAAPTERYRVTGVFESGDEDEGRMFVARKPRPEEAHFTYALVSAPGGEADIDALNSSLKAVGAGVELTPLRQVLHGEQAVIGKINLLTGVALIAVLLLSSVGVTAAVLSRVIERRKELALLQAIGAKRRSVVAFLLSEGAAVGVAAALLGYAIGTSLSQVIVRQVFGVSVSPHIAPFLAAVAVSVVIAVLAASIGARRALRMETAVLLKGE